VDPLSELKDNIEDIKDRPAGLAITGKRQSIEEYASGEDLSNLNGHTRHKNKNADIENSLKAEPFDDNNSMNALQDGSVPNSAKGGSTKGKQRP